MVEGYSYEYLVQNSTFSGSPYSITVQLQRQLDQIKFTQYYYDYDFQIGLMKLFISLYDAHTMYIAPLPYRNSFIIFPFEYTSRIGGNGLQEIVIKSDNPVYSSATGKPLSNLGGRAIVSINGMRALDFLNKLADIVPYSKSAPARFNHALKMKDVSLGSFPLPNFNYLNYFLDDGTFVSYPLAVVLSQAILGVADFQRLMRETTGLTTQTPSHQFPQPTMAINPMLLHEEMKPPQIAMKTQVKPRGDNPNLILLYKASDASIMYYYQPNLRVSVFKIASFNPSSKTSNQPWDEFKTVIELGVAHAKVWNIKNVVLDLQANGGGFVCLNNAVLRYLIKAYSNLSELYQPFEFKKNNLVNIARPFFYTPQQYLNTTSLRKFVNDDFWNYGVIKNLGNVRASYSQNFYIDCTAQGNFFFEKAPHYFNKFIILTDGLCGSSCSQFASKLIFNKEGIGG